MHTNPVATICLIFSVILMHVGSLQAETPPSVVQKEVLALQTFFRPNEQAVLEALWKRAMAIEGVDCAMRAGAVPHMTTGSWRVSPSELQEAMAVLSPRLDGLTELPMTVRLEEGEYEGSIGWELIPESSPALLEYHCAVLTRLGFTYEPFRKIDIPGQWLPHITLFSVKKESAPRVREQLEPILTELREIHTLHAARLGLVTFQYPFKIVAEKALRGQ
ncbi:MAG: hypothetical protein SFY80_13770 [Verrucomicrobiota bacterium]|nr:hypothetical protein [Verrucomicrobiota bacterium]